MEERNTSINITSRDWRVLCTKIKLVILIRYLVRVKIKIQVDIAEKVALNLLECIIFNN